MANEINNLEEAVAGPEPDRVGVFIGLFKHALDAKKRITIPLEWRRQVGSLETLFVVPIHSQCLYVLPAHEMVRRLGRHRGHSLADFDASASDRDLGYRSELLGWDGQGRIRIRDDLLAHAQLDDQVMLVGAFERFELWNPKVWEKRVAEAIDPDEAARRMGL